MTEAKNAWGWIEGHMAIAVGLLMLLFCMVAIADTETWTAIAFLVAGAGWGRLEILTRTTGGI